jgi:hypothetical protein
MYLSFRTATWEYVDTNLASLRWGFFICRLFRTFTQKYYMQYNDFILFGFGLGGVLIHNLTKINELKKAGTFKASAYFSMEWASISISLIIVILAIMGKHEVVTLEQAGLSLGLAFTAIGYMGQSLFVKLMGKASKALGDKTDGNAA